MLSLAYQAIKKRLHDAIPGIAGRIHWYNSLVTDEQPAFQTPALFIEFEETQLHELKGYTNKHAQGGRLNFSIHCIEQISHDDDAVLSALCIAEKVHLALHKRDFKLSELPAFASLNGTSDDLVLLSTIVRTAVSADHRHVGLVDSVVRFGCEVVDGGG